MKYIKFIAMFLFSIFLISFILPQNIVVLPHAKAQSNDRLTIIDWFLIKFYNWSFDITFGDTDIGNIRSYLFNQYRTPWKVGVRLGLPEMFVVIPDTIDIRYLNRTEITIGIIDSETGEWMVPGTNYFISGTDYEFKLDFPSDVPENAFTYNFDPSIINTGEAVVTKLTINPNIPLLEAYPGDILITLNATKHMTYKNFFSKKETTIGLPWALFYPWAWELAGKRNLERSAKAEFVVKVERFHFAEIDPPEPIEAASDDIISIPIEIRNYGSHIDTFNFRVRTTDEDMLITPPPALTLKPGEEAQALVGVAAPKSFISIGSTTSIFLDAYSVDDPKSVFSNTIILSTVGINATGGSAYSFISLLITLFVVIAIILYFLKRRREKIIKKPEKPWEIPEEKKYLETLESKDKKKYNETLEMMRDEYKSALLWHKYYCDYLLRKQKTSGKKIEIRSGFKVLSDKINKSLAKRKKARWDKLKAKEKKLKAEKKKVEPKKEEIKEIKPAEEPKKVEQVKQKEVKLKEKIFNRQAVLEKRRKRQVIDRIKREQAKQIRKVGD